MNKFRTLYAREIDCRVSTCSKKGVSLLLYKDARCDMRILDETVGPENWQRKHEVINGNLFCSVGIKFDDEWVWKQDVGTESYTEKEKGQASDSFKRACFNWGIGRELYTAPHIFIQSEDVTLEDTGRCDRYNKPIFTTYDKFKVTQIIIENGEIVAIAIKNTSLNKMVFKHDIRKKDDK